MGSRYANFANNYEVDAYGLLGLRAGLNREHWKVFAEIKNLFDVKFVASQSVDDRASLTDAILSPG